MIENVPELRKKDLQEAVKLLASQKIEPLLRKINDEYAYWDKVKYLAPEGTDSRVLWQTVKLQRMLNAKTITFGRYTFRFTVTERMLVLLHEFDMNMGGNLGTQNLIPEDDRNFYLVSSIMEEAIASSQMEGASTTRKVAKEMLRKQQKPKDKGQQMIVNNYSTIRYLAEHRQDEFSVSKLLEIHRLISSKTLENHDEEGSIRQDDNVVVMNDITGEIVHIPPRHEEVEQLLKEVCEFANNDNPDDFIHPIIKGMIIHFMIAFIHPFSDGNGRTARSLVYWYLIKKGYWLTEYLSISRIIYKNKNQYEKTFLYTENDNNDLSYFILFNLVTMKKAYEELKSYLQRKISERNSIAAVRLMNGISLRQSYIINIIKDKPDSIITVKEIATRFSVTEKTARTDLQSLVRRGLMEELPLNNRTIGYVKSDDFYNRIEQNGKKNAE